jgi:hypothetical protein
MFDNKGRISTSAELLRELPFQSRGARTATPACIKRSFKLASEQILKPGKNDYWKARNRTIHPLWILLADILGVPICIETILCSVRFH